MKLLKVLLLVFVLLLVTAAGAFLYYLNCPLYAFQEAYVAYQNKDILTFARRVDVDQIVESLLNDLLIEPAQSTPDLTSFQQQVGMGAVEMAKASISREIKRKLRGHFALGASQRKIARMQANAGQAAYAAEITEAKQASGDTILVAESSSEIKQLLNVTGKAMSSEMGKMKEEAYARMQTYLNRHPETLPGRILGKRTNQEDTMKTLLVDYGLAPENLKGIGSYSVVSRPTGGEIAHVGFNFQSPKCDSYLLVEIELTKLGNNQKWQISRFSNVKEILVQLGEDYQKDIHNLITYSLYGIGSEKMKNHMQNMGESIKQNEAAKNLLDKWKIKL